MSADGRHRQGHRVAVRIKHVGDTLTPRHRRRVTEHVYSCLAEDLNREVDVIHVDEHLETNAFAPNQAVLRPGPVGSDNSDLVLASAKSDVAWIANLRKLKVSLEAQSLIEGGGASDTCGEDDGKRTIGDRRRIRRGLRQRCVMTPEERTPAVASGS